MAQETKTLEDLKDLAGAVLAAEPVLPEAVIDAQPAQHDRSDGSEAQNGLT